jgi:hypothetical protein
MRFKVQMVSDSHMSMAYTGHGETLREAVAEIVAECLSMNHPPDVEFLSKNLLALEDTSRNIEADLKAAAKLMFPKEGDTPPPTNGNRDA